MEKTTQYLSKIMLAYRKNEKLENNCINRA